MKNINTLTKTKGELLTDSIAVLSYGDIISHEQIEQLLGCNKESSAYKNAVSKAKKKLRREHSLAIESLRGIGYRVVKPDDFTDYALGYYKRGIHTLENGRDYLRNAPTRDMSIEARETYRRVNDRAVILEASMKGVRTELKTLARKQSAFDPELVGRR